MKGSYSQIDLTINSLSLLGFEQRRSAVTQEKWMASNPKPSRGEHAEGCKVSIEEEPEIMPSWKWAWECTDNCPYDAAIQRLSRAFLAQV